MGKREAERVCGNCDHFAPGPPSRARLDCFEALGHSGVCSPPNWPAYTRYDQQRCDRVDYIWSDGGLKWTPIGGPSKRKDKGGRR